MKTLTTILLLLSINVIGQTQRKITYSQTHQFANNVSGVYDVYQDRDSVNYLTGDTLRFFTERNIFMYERVERMDTIKVFGNNVTEAYCIIKSIKVVGNNRRGYVAKITVEAYDMMYLFMESNRECIYEGRVMFVVRFKV